MRKPIEGFKEWFFSIWKAREELPVVRALALVMVSDLWFACFLETPSKTETASRIDKI